MLCVTGKQGVLPTVQRYDSAVGFETNIHLTHLLLSSYLVANCSMSDRIYFMSCMLRYI